MINREDYKDWEKQIINTVYKNKKKSKKKSKNKSNSKGEIYFPTNNHPIHVTKKKVVIVLDFVNKDNIKLSDLVSKSNKSNKSQIPIKDSIQLYHIGNSKIDDVSLGLDERAEEFKFPALDLGGLTNVKQKPGLKIKLLSNRFLLKHNTKITKKLLDDIYDHWLKLSDKKTFYNASKMAFRKFMESVIKFLKNNRDKYNGVYIRYYKLPNDKRIVLTSSDIYNMTGHYYLRNYAKGDDNYGQSIRPNKSLYCSVTKQFITPNIYKRNIMNEYVLN